MKKVINPMSVETGEGRRALVFCEIEYKDGRLSITGVVGPMRNGDCMGACGQINMSFAEEYTEDKREYAEGWNKELFDEFLQTWDAWHLNDMRAGCGHQRAMGWGKDKVAVVTYQLTDETSEKQRKIKQGAMARLEQGETVTLPEGDIKILSLEWQIKRAEVLPVELAAHYKEKSREEKLTSWIYPREDYRGVLCKPCPTCGYQYGSAWLKEDVPTAVLDFLRSLPDTKTTPAWV